MKYYIYIIGILLLLTAGCHRKEQAEIVYFPEKWHYNESPKIVFKNLKEKNVRIIRFEIDSLIRGGARVFDTVRLIGLRDIPLGPHEVRFYIEFPDGSKQVIRRKFTLYARKPPAKWNYRLINTYPHDIHAFTQGLEFDGDTLFESTGLYKHSSLRKTDYRKGDILRMHRFDPGIFAEGLTLWGDSILVLTWQSGKGFVFDRQFHKIGEFPYGKSKEGWGLCHNDRWIFKSDGTEKIWLLDPRTLREKGFINVYGHDNKIQKINELEWVDGKIFTNIWQKNALAVINPETGEVEAVIDLSELQKRVQPHPQLDVLNGIAYHPERKTLFVTGKNWDKMFEIEIIPSKK